MSTRARHYALVSNIDLRMLRRQKDRLVNILDDLAERKQGEPIFLDYNDKRALKGILHLMDAIEDKCNVGSRHDEIPTNNAEKGMPV